MATVADFRRVALSFPDTEESSHMGQPDFRVGGRIFATLAMADKGYGNLMLTPEIQAGLIADAPEIFIPIHGGWGRMGSTHIILAAADKDTLHDALQTAYKLRVSKNSATAKSKSAPKSRKPR
jgi:hypothetical protein